MFTIIGAMAELESSLVSERVTAGMQAAKARGKRLGRPKLSASVIKNVEKLAVITNLSVRKIHEECKGTISRGMVGKIVKVARSSHITR